MKRAERERAAQDNDKLLAALLHVPILQHLELSRQRSKCWGLAYAGGCPHLSWSMILSQFN